MAGPAGTSSFKAWSDVYDTVYQLYWVEDRTLEETMSILKHQYSFSATKKQWVSKLDQWKLKKNATAKEMQNMVRIQRKRRFEEDKDTRFNIRGRPVSQCNIDRWEKRQKGDSGEPVNEAETPSDISYNTPSEASRATSEIDPSTPRPVLEEIPAPRDDMPNFSTLSIAPQYHSVPPEAPAIPLQPSDGPMQEVDPLEETEQNGEREQAPTEGTYQPGAASVDLDHDVDMVNSPDSPDSIIEIDRDEMYFSDSSDSSVATIAAEEYTMAVGDFCSLEVQDLESKDTMNKALRSAARSGNATLIQSLLEAGAELESQSQLRKTALQAAIFHGHVEATAVLLRYGADFASCAAKEADFSLSVTEPSGRRKLVRLEGPLPLHIAAARGHCEIINLLLDHGADLDAEDENENTPLLCAIESCQDSVVTQLLDNGARFDSEVQDPDGRTAWDLSVIMGHEGYIRQLLARRGNLRPESSELLSPLWLAVIDEHEDIIQLFIEIGTHVEKVQVFKDASGDSSEALKLAIDRGHEDIVCLFLDEYAIEVPENELLLRAITSGHTSVLQAFEDRGADFTTNLSTGTSPLIVASSRGHCDVVRWLLDREFHIESDRVGTALWHAAKAGHGRTVELLLDRGANIEFQSLGAHSSTALSEAAKAGHIGVVEVLLDNGADIGGIFSKIPTALFEAAREGRESMVKLLLDRGARTTYTESFTPYEEKSALWAAVGSQNSVVVKLLLNKGANVGYRGRDYSSPLSLAVRLKDVKVIRMLLEHGATAESLGWWEKEWLQRILAQADTP
ncbi:ankyrin repeat-containing domain protein [Cercophora newfieldiana]|uniref:Ankyrin repeat-containing domain protein n=1 Tax=Cercophora newfieldiana TaxID=92897 RepID=A0AA40CIR5_9PEZI|nr:ankyrin repeat-containing domain protein [Cercophora newfieldiana]